MNDAMFAELFEQLAGNIWLQGVIIALGVCFLEDAARCATGLLVASGCIDWWVAFSWMMIGSLLGDLGLYLIGRYAMGFIVGRRWINSARIERMKLYFSRHAIKAIIGARFFPGARTVAYAAAGAVRYRLVKFFAVLSAVTLLQTLLFLFGTDLLGDKVLAYLDNPRSRWVAGAALVAVILIAHFIAAAKGRPRIEKTATPPL